VPLIDQAIELMLAHPGADSLRSVCQPAQTPYKMWHMVDGLLQPVLSLPSVVEAYCQPRQSLPEVYWQNGYVDIVRPRVVLDRNLMCGDRILPFVVREPALELDYLDNIPAIEAALVKLQQGRWPDPDTGGDRHAV